MTLSSEKIQEEMEKLLADMHRERDELIVQAHLLKAEAKNEWEKVEKDWEHFKAKAEQVGAEAHEASGDVAAAAKLLGEELKQSYVRIKKLL